MRARFAQKWQFCDFVCKIYAISRKIMGNFGFYAKKIMLFVRKMLVKITI